MRENKLENKWVFRRLQKTGKVRADVMSGGRLFLSRMQSCVSGKIFLKIGSVNQWTNRQTNRQVRGRTDCPRRKY